MARIDRRLRLWAWIAQRQTAATVQGEDAVIAMQSRAFPDNALMNFIFGSPGPGRGQRPDDPGPGGRTADSIYQPPTASPRPLVLNIHGGGHQTLLYPATNLTRVAPLTAGRSRCSCRCPRCRPTGATT